MSSRETILGRVREAIGQAADVVPPRDYQRDLELDRDALINLFVERLIDYKADVRRSSSSRLASTIGTVLSEYAATSVVVPADLDPTWLTTVTGQVVRDDPPLPARSLDQISAVITGSTVSIALTGTIVLDGGAVQGRRAISLIPDLHLCVVPAESVVGSVPEAIERLDPTRPQTWISGPSATSDIELDRVEGVHGPRKLVVLITDA